MSNLSSTWFQGIKKIKTDNDFVQQQASLGTLLDQGLPVDSEDPQGRTALQMLFAKPSPSVRAANWLLDKGADPDRVTDLRLSISDLYPQTGDSAEQLQDKQYRAAPYLALMAAHEARYGAEQGVVDSHYYQQIFQKALATSQRIEALKACFTDLPLGYRLCTTAMKHPWQSHWGGLPWLPSKAPAPALAPELRLLCQLHFDALAGPHPLPSTGLLQVFVDPEALEVAAQDPSGDPRCHRQPLTVLYWPELPASPSDWQPMAQWQLRGSECRLSDLPPGEPQAISWQPRRQLDGQHLDAQMATLPAHLRPDAKALDDELQSYDFGLLPQLGSLSQEYLPKGHLPLLHLLHQSYGLLLLSLPAQALAGQHSDWQGLVLTRSYD